VVHPESSASTTLGMVAAGKILVEAVR
jgi:hypothetical protein